MSQNASWLATHRPIIVGGDGVSCGRRVESSVISSSSGDCAIVQLWVENCGGRMPGFRVTTRGGFVAELA